MYSNDTSYNKALNAIRDLMNDMGASVEETINNLEALKDEIDIFIEALKEDL